MTDPFALSARSLLLKVNEEYGCETFISEGYGYFDDVTDAIEKALRDAEAAGYRRAIDAAVDHLCDFKGDNDPEAREYCAELIRALNPQPALPEGEVK